MCIAEKCVLDKYSALDKYSRNWQIYITTQAAYYKFNHQHMSDMSKLERVALMKLLGYTPLIC